MCFSFLLFYFDYFCSVLILENVDLARASLTLALFRHTWQTYNITKMVFFCGFCLKFVKFRENLNENRIMFRSLTSTWGNDMLVEYWNSLSNGKLEIDCLVFKNVFGVAELNAWNISKFSCISAVWWIYSASTLFPFPNELQVSVDQIWGTVFLELIFLSLWILQLQPNGMRCWKSIVCSGTRRHCSLTI